MEIVLIVGHKEFSQGASNKTYNIAEFGFNTSLVDDIIDQYIGDNVLIKVLRTSYRSVPYSVNEKNPDFAISFHCNAYNTKVSGTEMLYYHRSTKGKLMAEILQKNICDALHLRSRGIKPKTVEDRGGYILKYIYCPIVIAEPFFIDNDSDYDIALEHRDALIKAYVKSIDDISLVI